MPRVRCAPHGDRHRLHRVTLTVVFPVFEIGDALITTRLADLIGGTRQEILFGGGQASNVVLEQGRSIAAV